MWRKNFFTLDRMRSLIRYRCGRLEIVRRFEGLPEVSQIIENLDQLPPQHAGGWHGGWPQDSVEFGDFVETFQHRLIRYAWRRLGNFHDAQDVTQEVFARAFTEREKHRHVSNVCGYLYRMVANMCIDLMRRRKFHVVSLNEDQIISIPAQTPDGLMLAIAAEKLRLIDNLLKRISPRQAEVIRLRVFDELGPAEIAKMLGLPVTMVNARLRHGLEKLRRIVSQEGAIQ